MRRVNHLDLWLLSKLSAIEKRSYTELCNVYQVRKSYSYHLAWIYDDSEKMVRFSCLEIAILGKLFLMISKNMIS